MDLDRIIEDLLVSDTGTVERASKDLEKALKQPESFVGLLNITIGHAHPSHRQLSAVLLKKHLSKLRDYQKVPMEVRLQIMNLLLNAVFNEKDMVVCASMVLVLGTILRHEQQNNVWTNKILLDIVNQCASTDSQAVEIGSFVFAKLADIFPKIFAENFSAVKTLLETSIIALEGNSSNVSPSAIVNMLTAMSAIGTAILGNTEAMQSYEAAVPHIVNVTNKFALEGLIDPFTAGLDILFNMIEYTPKLLNIHVRLLMEFALAVSSNTSCNSEIRIKTLNFVCSMIDEKKKMLIKLKLIEPILNVLLNIMAAEPESDDADEFFEGEDETPLAAATMVIDKLATKMPPEKFIPPLLALLEPALNNTTDDLRRRSAYIIIATIAEGCKEAICDKYLKSMLNILKQGLNDPVTSVRNAALFAVGQFSEELQPEIAEYAEDILPFLFNHMQEILQAQQMGRNIDAKCAERVFYALEAFCNSMEDTLAPYMESLMSMVISLLSDDSLNRMKLLAMRLTESAAKAFKGSVLPWFQPLIEKLRPLLQENENNNIEIRSQAIETLAAIARNVDKEFIPAAPEAIQRSIVWIESTDDIDIRKSVINLFGALASVVGNDLEPVLPQILSHINRCIMENIEPVPALERITSEEQNEDEDEIEIESESSASVDSQCCGNSPYLEAKIQAVITLQELAESCMKILLPFAQQIFETIYILIDHEYDEMRKSSIEAATTFVIKWNQECSSDANAKQALYVLLPKLCDVVSKDEFPGVVVEAEEAICDILSSLGTIALPTKESRELIVQCVKQGLTYKYACLFTGDNSDEDSQDEGDSESDQLVIQGAASLLSALGKAVSPDEFAEYFKKLEPLIMKHMDNAYEGDFQIERGHLIGVLAECYAPLDKNVAPYFAKHYKMMIRDSKRRNTNTRQNAIYGLGELIRAADDISYNYIPEVLKVLSDVLINEEKRIVVDNILGALSRLILTNASQVPLHQVLPVMLQKLPIVEDEIETFVVIECFDLLYKNFSESMQAYTAAIVAIAVKSIINLSNNEIFVTNVVNLMQNIRTKYPDDYAQAIANPELNSILSIAQQYASNQL